MKFNVNNLLKLIFLLLFSWLYASGQHTSVKDSLSTLLLSETNDSAKTILLLKISEQFGEEKWDSTVCLCNRAIAIAQRINNEFLEAESNNCLGIAYLDGGKYALAEQHFSESIEYWIRNKEINISRYADVINNCGTANILLGNYSKAEQLLLASLQIFKQISPVSNSYATALNNLAGLYFSKGLYNKAEPLYSEAKEIWEKLFGKKHSAYAKVVNNMAMLYYNIGLLSRSESFYLESLELRKSIYGENHPNVSTVYSNLALVYEKTKRYKEAEELYLKAIKIREEKMGKNHPDCLSPKNNLALLYKTTGNTKKAKEMFLEILEARKEIFGENHPLYTHSLSNYTGVLLDDGNYSEALQNLLKISEKNLTQKGKQHPDYYSSLRTIAYVYQKTGNYAAADSLYASALDMMWDYVKRNFSFLSEEQKEEFWNRIQRENNTYLNYSIKRYSNNNEIAGDILNYSLQLKGTLIRSNLEIRNEVMNSNDTSIIALYETWKEAREKMGKSIELNTSKNNSTDSLNERVIQLENKLALRSTAFAEDKIKADNNWKDIQKVLQKDEFAIDIFRNIVDFSNDSIEYYAIVFGTDIPVPFLKRLGSEKEIQCYLKKDDKGNITYINNLEDNKRLYNLIWKPFEQIFPEGTIVYISSSGILNGISWNALTDNNNNLLLHKHQIIPVFSLFDIIQKIKKDKKNFSKKSLIFGGINYTFPKDLLLKKLDETNSDLIEKEIVKNENDEKSNFAWTYLPGTKEEAEKISSIFTNKKMENILLKEFNATEEAFKELEGKKSPRIIHFATHGYYVSVADSTVWGQSVNIFETNKNPMFRSGLLLAGSNRAWNGNVPLKNIEDGVLTAYEVSNTYLPNTELVVLSACETGLGDIRGNEGVYGLQRAFRMSGVEAILYSLWSVPDKETVELMELFYKEWFSGKSKSSAFREAQKKMSNQYPPYYWASFVLSY